MDLIIRRARIFEVCPARYPQLEFHHGDATDLSRFEDRHFDAVVFSANGIEYIRTDEGRAKCLREVARVLKPGGVFVVSSHNAQAIGVWPQLKTAHGIQIPWRILYSLYASARLAARHLSHAAFWKGSGYRSTRSFGGLAIYSSTPRIFAPQVEMQGSESSRLRRSALSGRASALANAVVLLRVPQNATGMIAAPLTMGIPLLMQSRSNAVQLAGKTLARCLPERRPNAVIASQWPLTVLTIARGS